MKIKWIEYENLCTGLKIDRLSFSALTLLVGVSGTGKTSILAAIDLFRSIAQREYVKEMFDTAVRTSFEIEGDEYEWYIKFGGELPGDNESADLAATAGAKDKNIKVPVLEEYLSLNGRPHFESGSDGIKYQGNKIPGLSQIMSCVNLFEEDGAVKKLCGAFKNILLYSVNDWRNLIAPLPKESILVKYSPESLTKKIPPYIKLCLLQKRGREDIFDEIKHSYQAIFKTVEDLYFVLDEASNSYILYQTEKGASEPINCRYISSGMYKTLMLLTDLYTCCEGSVFMIDEFENSFGANCINEVVDIIKIHEDKYQFIITSHHPYIINNISSNNWSVVGRKGSLICAKTAKEYGIGASKQDAFFELINLWSYDDE